MTPHKSPFDENLRHLLADSSGGGQWDTPSDKVWQGVHARISHQRRWRGAIWWILAGLVLLFSGSMGYLYFTDRGPASPAVEYISAPIATNPQLPPSDQSEISPTQTDMETQEISPAPVSTQKIDTPTDTDVRALPHHTSGTMKVSMPSTAQGSAPLANDTQPPSTTSPHITSVEDTPDHTMTRTASSTQIDATDRAGTTEGPAPRSHTDQPALFTPLVLYPLESGSRFPMIESDPLLSRSTRSRWSLTLHIAPSLGTRRIDVPEGRPHVQRMLLKREESPVLQPAAGLTLSYDLPGRWEAGIGIGYNQILLNGASSHQVRYTRIGERINGRGNIENQLRLRLNTSFGEVSTDIVVERSPGSQIEEHRFININLETQHRMSMLEVPLTIGYRISGGRLNTSLYGGITGSVLLDNTLDIHAVRTSSGTLLLAHTDRRHTLKGMRDMIWGYHFGVGVEVPLHAQWSLMLQPQVTGSFQSIHQNTQVAVYPFIYEVQIGVRHTFYQTSRTTLR